MKTDFDALVKLVPTICPSAHARAGEVWWVMIIECRHGEWAGAGEPYEALRSAFITSSFWHNGAFA